MKAALDFISNFVFGLKGDEFVAVEQASLLYFLVVKYLVIFFATMCVISLNPVHSVLYLIGTFVAVAVLLVSLGVEFLGILLIIVYVGAIAVLFLFIVMMLNVTKAEVERKSMVIQLLSSMTIVLVFVKVYSSYAYGHFGFFHSPLAVGQLPIYDFFYLPWTDGLSALDNVSMLGTLLYTHYAHLVLLAGFVLFLAMISSIALTLAPRSRFHVGKAQNKHSQIKRQVSEAVHLSDWSRIDSQQ